MVGMETEQVSGPAEGGVVGVSGVLVAAVEACWGAVRARHPQVPAVVVTLGSGTIGAGRAGPRLGHFAAGRWHVGGADGVCELFVGGEGLRDGALELLCTLLHEAAHGLAHTRGIKDTSRQGRYHNTRYATLARELGLEVSEDRHGWHKTVVPDATAAVYAAQLAELEAALVAWRHPERQRPRTLTPGGGGRPEPGAGPAGDTDPDGSHDDDQGEPAVGPAGQVEKNGVVAVCDCTPPRRMRITRSVLTVGPITCGICGTDFTAAAAASGRRPG
jgi:hypothetical protein